MLLEGGIDKTAKYANKLGLNSVEFLEIDSPTWYHAVSDTSQAEQIKRALSVYGLTTSCYSVAVNLLEEGSESFLKRHAEYAAALGSPFLHHTLINWLTLPPNAPSFENVFEPIVEKSLRIVDYCQRLGLIVLYEEQGLYFNGIKNFGKFFKTVKAHGNNVGVCGDMGNILFADEKPRDFFATYKNDIKHVHLKDYYKKRTLPAGEKETDWMRSQNGEYIKDAPFGKGVVSFIDCFRTLQELPYNGAFSLETLNPIKDNDWAVQYVKQAYYADGTKKLPKRFV